MDLGWRVNLKLLARQNKAWGRATAQWSFRGSSWQIPFDLWKPNPPDVDFSFRFFGVIFVGYQSAWSLGSITASQASIRVHWQWLWRHWQCSTLLKGCNKSWRVTPGASQMVGSLNTLSWAFPNPRKTARDQRSKSPPHLSAVLRIHTSTCAKEQAMFLFSFQKRFNSSDPIELWGEDKRTLHYIYFDQKQQMNYM